MSRLNSSDSPEVPLDHGVTPDNSLSSAPNATPSAEQDTAPVTSDNYDGRKRRWRKLSKACDACHSSKRRCDGTAPCSNCHYTYKTCTYTDAAGRPVPAPRQEDPERRARVAAVQKTMKRRSQPAQAPPSSTQADHQDHQGCSSAKRLKRSRNQQGAVDSRDLLRFKRKSPPETFTYTFDPVVAHELVNIFFAHCNPQRMIIHKHSFFTNLAMNQIPPYLVLAVCAIAAPWSKAATNEGSNWRLAGVPFFQQALSLMFDESHVNLLCRPTVSTVQALCLLEMHEIAASHPLTLQFKYFGMALEILQGSLGLQHSNDSSPPSPMDWGTLMELIDRECTQRCFSLILLMEWIANIHTHRIVQPRIAELANVVRLPLDEVTFELPSMGNSETFEYLGHPAPQTVYVSQFGQVLRILEIYHRIENVLTNEEDRLVCVIAMAPLRKQLETWKDSLPRHLRFNEENVQKQVTAFDTSSNCGAWCFCFMHAMYACCYLAVLEGEGTLLEPIPWIRDQLSLIFKAVGIRTKSSILLACALWSYSKYSPDDPQLHIWDCEFEEQWGFRVATVAAQWMQKHARTRQDSALIQYEQPRRQHPRQQQQLQYQQVVDDETPSSNSRSNSPTSSHSWENANNLYTEPYEGWREHIPQAHLCADVSMHNANSWSKVESRITLPSLEQTGLLEPWPESSLLGSHLTTNRDGCGVVPASEPDANSGYAIQSLLPSVSQLLDGFQP